MDNVTNEIRRDLAIKIKRKRLPFLTIVYQPFQAISRSIELWFVTYGECFQKHLEANLHTIATR